MSRMTVILVAVGLIGWFGGWAGGQARNTTEPKPAPPPYIVVTKTDGTLVKGQLTASDPGALTVTPPAAPGKPANDPVVIKWAEVSKVSNGLTRAKVLEQWKGEHKDQLCEACKGAGTVACATCKGTQHDPAKLPKDCGTCKGELLVDCKAPKCDKGQVPCPRPCLKLTDGGWITKPNGLKYRHFPIKDGYYEVSEHHLGELVVNDKEGKKTVIPCPTCGTAGKVDCPTCHGEAKVPCPTCSKNDVAPKCADCDKGRQPCKSCEGTGVRK